MEIEIGVDTDVLETALKAGRAVGQTTPGRNLKAPLQSALLALVDDAWDRVERVLRKAFRATRDALISLQDEAVREVEEVLKKAGAKALEVEAALRERIETYLRSFVNAALQRVPTRITIGDGLLSLVKVQITHKLLLSGTLKTSIDGALSMTTGGELSIQGEYARSNP
jgi:hypothetical protein